MRLIICLLFFYIALNVNIASYSLVLEDINKEYFLSPELSYLNDKTNNLDIKDIDTKYKDKFSTEQLKSTNFGYSKYSHWFKFNIINKTNIDKWLLVIEFPKLYDVKLYNRDSNKFNVQENGTILKPSDRDIKSRKIVFNLPTKEGNNNFYIKVYSPETAVQVPMKIMTKDVFSTESMYEENFFMLFLGIFLGMIVYNFVVLVFFKEIIYLFYVLFNFSLFLTQLATNGYGYYYIWGNSSFEPISIRFCGNILFLSFTIFLMSFFDINRKNKFFNFFSIMAIFDFIHLILGLLHLLNIAYISKFIMIQAIVFVYILIYYLIKNKDKSTKILFISWTVLSLGIVIFLLNRMGLVEKNAFTDHILLIASSMSSIIISLAISEKFQSYKIQKEVYSRELELANEKLIDYKNNLEDIVERKTVELKESKEKAEKIAKLKSDFLASMSHDIRTPINGVMGMTELLSMTKLDQEQKGLVKTISSSSEILLNLINDILDISKFESGKMELDKQKFNLRLSIENLIEILWFKANEKNLDIYYYISPEIPEVIVTDSHKLLRIIMNLISNSIKFTETGYIKLDIKLIYKDEKICNISFSVKDTGIGIPDDKKEKLFKPFTQVDSSITNKFGGTGLGLTISKNIVDLMDGEISFQNNKDLEGTTFNFNIKVPYINHYEKLPKKTFLSNKKVFIYSDNLEFIELVTKYSNDVNLIVFSSINDDILKTNFDVLILDTDKKYLDSNISVPIVSYSKNNTQKIGSYNLHIPLKTYDFYNIIYQAINNIKVNEKENDNHNTNKFLKPREKIKNLRILVAEDNLVNQKLIQKVFDKLGYKIDLVNNGLEAVQICKEKEYDLILMDVQMPEMDGIEATKQIRLNLLDKTPKIVALTANVLQEQKDECLKVGMSDFLTKPFKISDIQNLVLTISNK